MVIRVPQANVKTPKCGPDVTEHYLDGLSRFMKAIDEIRAKYPPDWRVGGREMYEYDANGLARIAAEFGAVLGLVKPGSPVDYKSKRGEFSTCATLQCENTVLMCGLCVGDDVPGNIAYGFALDYTALLPEAIASAISDAQNRVGTVSADNKFGRNDSPQDKASIRAGQSASKKLKAKKAAGKNTGDKLTKEEKQAKERFELKDAICEEIGKQGMDVRADCPACGEVFI